MKKIEIYLTNDEHAELMTKIQNFQERIMKNQEDGVYSEKERAEIMDASGSISFYMKKGLKKQLSEMEEYIEDKASKAVLNKTEALKEKIQVKAQSPVKEKTESDLMRPLQCETQEEEARDFDFNV